MWLVTKLDRESVRMVEITMVDCVIIHSKVFRDQSQQTAMIHVIIATISWYRINLEHTKCLIGIYHTMDISKSCTVKPLVKVAPNPKI